MRMYSTTPLLKIKKSILSSAARGLADARKHNALQSTLMILIYGKESLRGPHRCQAPRHLPHYHIPHTLARYPIYYWLFLAIVLGTASWWLC
jgi:hypothetical protein